MYVPAHFAASAEQVEHLLATTGAGDLVTVHEGAPVATFLPFLYDPARGERGVLSAHVARNNTQWRHTGTALVILHGADHYVSPSVLPSKHNGGLVVPTWNYITVHARGRLIAHDDRDWCADLVERMTARHEAGRDAPWSIADAPADAVDRMLRAVVGIDIHLTEVEGKVKFSQNKTPGDVAALAAEREALGDDAGARLYRSTSLPAAHARAALLADVARRGGRA